ncbi:hypothetical protein V1514DRAFT_327216 [Lipomyces japonicus]|uniref:uncharacterized protein n=1 Tax=Lipomyces japonicus TaxID=56871 RepID=UPI0034CFAA20
MNSTTYLTSYGWKPGTGLKKGSIAKPILVSHKKDKKGLGSKVHDHETWWERVFDGQLQNLDVYSESQNKNSINTTPLTIRASNNSPLYKKFVKGEGLRGSIGTTVVEVETAEFQKENKVTSDEIYCSITESLIDFKSKLSKKDQNVHEKKKKKKPRIEQKSDQDVWIRAIIKDSLKKKNKKLKSRNSKH